MVAESTKIMNWTFVHTPEDLACQREVPLGALNATVLLAKALRQKGHSTRLAAWCSHPDREFHGMEMLRIAGGDERCWQQALEASAPIDVLVGLSRVDIHRWNLGRRQLSWNHNPSVLYGIPEHGRPLYWMTQAVVCPSETSRRQQRSWGVPSPLLRVIPNGLDHSHFHPAESDEVEEQRRYRLAFVGSCSYWKGFDLVLEAYAWARTKFPQLTLDVYGDCPAWPSDLYPAPPLLKLDHTGCPDAAALGAILPGLCFHGKVSPATLGAALRRTGFLLCASRHEETFSLAALEAQACGCLPIAPSHGAYQERIRHGKTGFLFTHDTAEAFAAELLRVMGLEEDLRSARTAASRHAESFSWDRTANAFEALAMTLPPLGMIRRLGFNTHRGLKRLVSRS